METRMKATVLAKKLRARIKVLKAEREKTLKKYERDFEKWKIDVASWLKTVPATRVHSIKKSHLSDRRYGCHTSLPNFIFEGAPEPPAKPGDKTIREIQRTLRHIAFTGVSTVEVTERMLNEWFKNEESDEDDE